jgi:hypothetical protein
MITRSKTLDKISANHMDNGADMPHSMKAMIMNKPRTNRSAVIGRPDFPRLMLPINEEGDQLSSEVNSDTDLGEDDLSETDDEDDWETNF